MIATACAIGAAGLASVQAQLINVQILDDSINRNGNATTDEGSPIPLPVMTGQAVFGLTTNDYWNGVNSNLLTYTAFPSGAQITNPIPLLLSDGVTPSGVSMTLSAGHGTYNANSTLWSNHSPFSWPSLAAAQAAPANQDAGTFTPYSALMQTCMAVVQNASGNVTLTGLTVGQGYNVVVYTATDQNVSGGRKGQFTVNGQAQNYTWDGVTSNLVSGVSYLEFIGVAPDASGKLTIQFGGPNGETDLDGFQVQVAAAGPLPSQLINFNPDGTQFFNAANNFTFSIKSASSGGAQLPTNPTNQVHVTVNGQDVSSKLQFSGSNTFWNVTVPGLPVNTISCGVSMLVTNSAALVSSNFISFDTFNPGIVVPVETYDFNGGQHIDNFIPTNAPGATSYWGVTGVSNVDYFMVAGAGVSAGGAATTLAPNYPSRGDSNVAFQVAADLNLPLYVAQSNPAIYNVNLSFNNAGDWFNYTRTNWPSTLCVAYARVEGNNGAAGTEYLNILTNGYGTTTQATNTLGQFTAALNASWNAYIWVPLTDSSGNPLAISVPSGRQTLQLLSGGGLNVIDFFLAPIPTNGLPPSINNLNPALLTGGNVFVNTNTLTFSVNSLTSTVATNNIHTYINGVSVPETFTGTSSNWTVSVPLSVAANQPSVTWSVTAVDNNNNNAIPTSGTFDTFSQNNYMIEAEDFDFNGGSFIDNPFPTAPLYVALNSYGVAPAGNQANLSVLGVDVTTTNVTTAETYLYRIYDDNVGTEVTSDYLRSKFYNISGGNGEPANTTNSDYDVGWWPPGTWLNYTRTFPTGTYNVWGRLASGGAYTNATLSLVTSGGGGPSQITQQLGTFDDPNANGFQNWHWVEMMSNGAPAVVTLGGVETLKVTAPPGNATGSLNANFYMFVPYVPVASAPHLSVSRAGSTLSIQFATQSGSTYIVQYTGNLSPTSWQTLSSVPGDGTVKTVNDTVGGSQRFYRVEVTTP